MTDIPKSHPRYHSLMMREKLVKGFRNGLVAEAGLIAHGRGEAFDYLLGEETIPPAERAIRHAVAQMEKSQKVVLSVNGNVAALCGELIADLQRRYALAVEVNIFHRTEERLGRIVEHLERHGVENVLGLEPDSTIPGLDHARAKCCSHGIFGADLVLVPLEDGDRAKALVDMGKTVVTIDLNPLSRTSCTCTTTIVNEVCRTFEYMIREDVAKYDAGFDNAKNLEDVIHYINDRLKGLDLHKL